MAFKSLELSEIIEIQKIVTIHYFEYIVNSILPNSDENKDKILIDSFIEALKGVTKDGRAQ